MLLGELGLGYKDILNQFNVKTELYKSIANKSQYAFGIHTKHVKIGQYTLNEWLDPAKCNNLSHIENLFNAMIQQGYISMNQPAENSKFWQYMNSSTTGVMYGVFNNKEKELIKLYIENNYNHNNNQYNDINNDRNNYKLDSKMELLIDKYLGNTMKQHQHITLLDTDIHQYVSMNDIYENKRNKLLQYMSRYSTRKSINDSLCIGKMKRVMPEQDKKIFLEWLNINDNYSDSVSHTNNNNQTEQTIDLSNNQQQTIWSHDESTYKNKLDIIFDLHSKNDESTLLNTLLCVLSRYITPLNHWTDRGVFITSLYNTLIQHTSHDYVNQQWLQQLQDYQYNVLLTMLISLIQHTTLNLSIDISNTLKQYLTTDEIKIIKQLQKSNIDKNIQYNNNKSIVSYNTHKQVMRNSNSSMQHIWSNYLHFLIPLFMLFILTPLVTAIRQ